MKPILDPMCGPKMFYFDKDNANVLFGDIRWETHWTRQYKKLEIHPDKLMDARQLGFPDNSFCLAPYSETAGAAHPCPIQHDGVH